MIGESNPTGRSCFDTAYPVQSHFWSSIENKQQLDRIMAMPEICSAKLYVDGIKQTDLCQVVLKESLLYYTAEDGVEVRGAIKLDFQRAELIQVEKDEGVWYALKLRSSASSALLLSHDSHQITRWYKHLRKFVVNHDFESLYETKHIVGQGAFSRVYRVIHLKSQKEYAAKIIDHSKIFEEELLDRVVRQEIEILRSLNHPGISKLKEVHEIGEKVILILEYFKGQQLDELIVEKRSTADLSRIAWHLLNIASYLQKQGIIHRDIKPANLILIENGILDSDPAPIKLIDFGLSAYQHQRLIYSKCGTPGYVAPETLKSSYFQSIHADFKSDVYSIGIVLYELVYGHNPFNKEGEENSDIILERNAQLVVSVPELTQEGLQVDSDLRYAIGAMLKKKPEDRPSVDELLEFQFFRELECYRKIDYSAFTDEDIENKNLAVAYSFKVNKSKFRKPTESNSSSEEIDGIFLKQKSLFIKPGNIDSPGVRSNQKTKSKP